MRRPKPMSTLESLLARIIDINEDQCRWSPFPSSNAMFASLKLTTRYVLDEPMPDGWRCCEVAGVMFNGNTGLPHFNPDHHMTLTLDKAQDPVLAVILEDALQRLEKFKGNPRLMATKLTHYVDMLLLPDSIDDHYGDSWDRFVDENRGRVVPIGKIIKRRNGVCLPLAALMKYLGDRLGINLFMQCGVVFTDRDHPHCWTFLKDGGEELIYDAAQMVIDVPTPSHYGKYQL